MFVHKEKVCVQMLSWSHSHDFSYSKRTLAEFIVFIYSVFFRLLLTRMFQTFQKGRYNGTVAYKMISKIAHIFTVNVTPATIEISPVNDTEATKLQTSTSSKHLDDIDCSWLNRTSLYGFLFRSWMQNKNKIGISIRRRYIGFVMMTVVMFITIVR